jgi:ribonuclease III
MPSDQSHLSGKLNAEEFSLTTRHNKAGQSRKKSTPVSPFDHRFRRPDLLTWALTHRSLAYETKPDSLPDPAADNEQLEFLGDAVLGLAVAESLFRRFPTSREGELTRLRSSLVSRRHLGEVAARIDLGSHLRLGRGEEQSGGRRKPALLANALEAVIAALYLDGGLDAARAFIEKQIIEPTLPNLHLALKASETFSGAIGDHKSALQERLQATGAGQPHYVLTAQSGPDHQKRFRVEVRIEDKKGVSRALAESEGTTKKQAQQEAARLAFQRLVAESQLADAAVEEVVE